MRWVIAFITMAIIFGLSPEILGNMLGDSKTISYKTALIKGICFASGMTVWLKFQENRKTQ